MIKPERQAQTTSPDYRSRVPAILTAFLQLVYELLSSLRSILRMDDALEWTTCWLKDIPGARVSDARLVFRDVPGHAFPTGLEPGAKRHSG